MNETYILVIALGAIWLGFIALLIFWRLEVTKPLKLKRQKENPILGPDPAHWWESEAVFNPAAVYDQGRVHVLYRALGQDGISRIGYASSKDGVHFDERLPYPVFNPTRDFEVPSAARVYGPLSYSQTAYASGGGWGGSEDPRLVAIDDHIHMTFVAFDGWGYVRVALTSILKKDFLKKEWVWKNPALLSPPNEIHKNWVLFPEKIGGRYAILHSITPKILIEYVDSLEEFDAPDRFIRGSTRAGGREGKWDDIALGAGAPPLKTLYGWLVFYHGRSSKQPHIGYKVGAMLLDLDDPRRVLYRSNLPVLEPKEWYENDWKPGVTYASGAVIAGEDLFVYYGGGDKRVAVAKANLRDFLRQLMHGEHAELKPVTI
ncbi:MAG: glycosidase [Patescibacteria group bacterium]|nr:glycosidase [Patescibacteria group bacterium]